MTRQQLAAIREAAERIKLTAEQLTGIADLDGMNGFVQMGAEIQTGTANIIRTLDEAEKDTCTFEATDIMLCGLVAWKCSKCGGLQTSKANFCPGCGRTIAKEAAE
jgi:membrane protease subunit (stomatin/prohibitin family)